MTACPSLHPVPGYTGKPMYYWCLRSWKRADCAHCSGTLYYRSDNTRSSTRPTEGPEFACFDCVLPECDQTSPDCLYEQALVEAGKVAQECPHPSCHVTITEGAHTCTHHRWYK